MSTILKSKLMNMARAFSGRTGFAPQNSALQIDTSQTYTTLPPFVRRMPVTTFLRDRFFMASASFTTEEVLIDVYKNRQRIAPFVMNNAANPVNIKRDGYRTDKYTAPFINISQPIDNKLLQTRIPGEAIFGGMAPAEREAFYLAQSRQELDDMIVRREEVMAAELLQTGKVTVTGYIDDNATQIRTDTIDYDFTNIETLAAGDRWSEPTSEKYRDLEAMVQRIRQAGYNPTVAIFGEEAWGYARQDEKFLKLLDNRRAELGFLRPELQIQSGNGYTYLGHLNELGLDLFRYDAWYWDDVDGTLKPYIMPKRVIILSESIGERLYGANTIIPDGSENFQTVVGPRVTQIFVDRKKSTKEIVMKSRPVLAPFDVSSWGVLVVDTEA